MFSSNIAKQIHQVGEEFENIAAIFLFGSYARGEQRADSDIDIGVVTGAPLGTEDVLRINARFADISEPRVDVALLDGSDLFLAREVVNPYKVLYCKPDFDTAAYCSLIRRMYDDFRLLTQVQHEARVKRFQNAPLKD
jgi:predicted nucleotidyltransferase